MAALQHDFLGRLSERLGRGDRMDSNFVVGCHHGQQTLCADLPVEEVDDERPLEAKRHDGGFDHFAQGVVRVQYLFSLCMLVSLLLCVLCLPLLARLLSCSMPARVLALSALA